MSSHNNCLFVQLHLPPEVSCDVMISAVVAPNHVFVQQITHPTYPSLARLDFCMAQCYNEFETPGVPQPIQTSMICAAPSMDGWYRAKVVGVYPSPSLGSAVDEKVEQSLEKATTAQPGQVEASEADYDVEICFVDYGGYTRVPASCLRQIRADFMSLPFQAIECLLANVAPLTGNLLHL